MQPKTTVSHQSEDGGGFDRGLREYFEYRDLGIMEASGGFFAAHVIRAIAGKQAEPQWHNHQTAFQMFYVLKGWIEFEYDDIGAVRMEVGSSVFQPPGIRHRELRHSDDLEVLEIVSPGDFSTNVLENAP